MGKRMQKLLLLIILSIVVTSMPDFAVHSLATVLQKQIYNKNGIVVDFKVNSKWENGFEAQLIVTNSSNEPLENWRVKLKFDHEITSIWDGEIESHKGNTYIIKYPKWNTKIASGSKAVIEFNGKLKGTIKFPSECSILSEKTEVNKEDYLITYKTTSDWGDGFNGEISIKNNTNTTIEGWTLAFDFDKEIKQFWTAKLVKHENNHYIVKNDDWNSIIKPNQIIKLGFEGKPGKDIKEPINY